LPAALAWQVLQGSRMIELLTSDGGLAIFATVGIVATAVSIVRDAKAQKARAFGDLVPEEVSVDFPSAA
jgi:hypothetical protein